MKRWEYRYLLATIKVDLENLKEADNTPLEIMISDFQELEETVHAYVLSLTAELENEQCHS